MFITAKIVQMSYQMNMTIQIVEVMHVNLGQSTAMDFGVICKLNMGTFLTDIITPIAPQHQQNVSEIPAENRAIAVVIKALESYEIF